MLYGGPYTAHYGENREGLLDFVVEDDGTGLGAIVSLLINPGILPWWVLVADGIPQLVLYLSEGVRSEGNRVSYDATRGSHSVTAYPLGDWDNYDGLDVTFEQTDFEADKGKSVRVRAPAVMELIQDAWQDGAQLSNWVLSGLQRFVTCQPVPGRPAQAKLAVELLDVTGTRTVNLYVGNTLVATGSLVGDGSITLEEANDSGVTGSVDVAYTADIPFTDEAYVLGRWAEKYVLSTGALSKTIFDAGVGDTIQDTIGPLSAGVHTISLTAYSDSKVVGTPKTEDINVPGRPEPPGELSYVSGDWTDTTVEFEASDTPGAIYALYDVQEFDGPIHVAAPAALHIAGTGTISWTLPSLASAGTGKRRIIISAFNGDIEDGIRRTLTIEYAAGVVVDPRPNVPAFEYRSTDPVTAGRTLNVQYVYNASAEVGVATKIQVWLLAEGDAIPPDGDTPDSEATLASPVGGISRGTVSATAPANGHFRVLLRAATALGTQSENSTPLEQKYVSNVAPAAAASLELEVVS
jgi:hypothetical protein